MRGARSWLRRLVPLAVSIGVLAWLFASLDFAALLEALSWSVAVILGPALVGYAGVALWLEAVSLMCLLRPAPEGFGAWTAVRIKSASYLLGIVNYVLGAAALTVLIRRHAGFGLGRSASVVMMITGVDLLLSLSLITSGAAVSETKTPALGAGVMALMIGGSLAGLIALRSGARMGPLERLRSLAIFEALRDTSVRTLVELVALRLLFTFAFVAVGGFAFLSFGISIDATALLVGILFVALVAALPIAIAGLGTSQVAFLYVFRGLAEQEVLLAVSLVLSAGMILLRVAMGLAFARELTREALEVTRAEETQ